ncbi:FxsA family protein [Natranaerobius trueperi]|uniref:FxsA protein n=1 Tax=Natranaerobius trueperi TaxID=759412 RepID=A0A226C0Y6_9FIRM|nr:FxsA family protein [Natranaerobius trueperi]OWZ84692.1 FxsA protein [Natranaerobius trueperi]
MLVKALLIFTLIPLLEVWVLARLGQSIGPLPTIVLVAITGFVGVFLAKSQGLIVITKLQKRLSTGQLPTDELFSGACILVGGALLLTPGVVTDIFGLTLLIPFTRPIWKKLFHRIIKAMTKKGNLNIYYSGNFNNEPNYYDVDYEVDYDEDKID